MNNKGFTLVELLATILILALLIGIGTYSITTIINNAKDRNYQLLITNIKDAAEAYYQECRYEPASKYQQYVYGYNQGEDDETNGKGIICKLDAEKNYQTTLGDLVKYGFLKGNAKNDDDYKYSVSNPYDEEDISTCKISISFSNGHVHVNAIPSNTTQSCPTDDDYNPSEEE